MHKNYDKILHIQTGNLSVRPDQSAHYNHYEATPYSILYSLFQAYEIKRSDSFVDYGSGKGRLLYYVHHHFGASVTGIEMNEKLHKDTLKNYQTYMKKRKKTANPIEINCCLAENYPIKSIDNRFYFFNPFSVQIFMKIIHNILRSVEENKRSVDIILYYPTSEYIQYLETKTPFQRYQEVRVPGLYEKNTNERFVMYRFTS